ncbi:MAG: hypothetical protein JWM31_3692, partial [Solirubrobacterales bacterium]|nr:hypothetical protein [Solirubrobacterales bacterium]
MAFRRRHTSRRALAGLAVAAPLLAG